MQTILEPPSLQNYATDYFRSRCKPKSQHRVGMEVEHICVRTSDGQRIAYDTGDGCVLTLLDELQTSLGGEQVFRGDLLFGIEGDWGKVTLEPGNQIEWSSPARATSQDLQADLDHWLLHFNTALRNNGVVAVSSGLDGTNIRRVPWIPKRRYDIMADHYRRNANVAHRAMLNTAGVHVSFDYADAQDWQRKFRALTVATPAAIALFANSPGRFRDQSFVALRPVLWLEMDEQRSSLPNDAFSPDYSLERWADWVTDRPALLQEIEGTLHPGDNRSLSDAYEAHEGFDDVWKLQVGTIFTPVRSHAHLEVRTIDTQPDDRLAAVPAFWAGLVSHEPTLNRVLDVLAEIQDEVTWRNLFYRACRFGLEDAPINQLAGTLLELAREGLNAAEGRSDALATLALMR